ncbi:aldehyde dehydrogenase family protein [Nesterenkonia alkaliphila]|uniref:aldehyde dehydrogenase family protein n=1 Tax=Nesterenkonia alkaliphila TaxID=1463631 RepID=UPI00198EF263|nr:aldehyde dehydrogenase family protein [Nesterenkonia alkaliphila]GFZ98413.1 hypothetical protein GCM10011359_29460 [Nesterenkonia alkaliphila]
MKTQLIIDNSERRSSDSKTFVRRNPLNGEVITQAAAATIDDAAEAVDSAAKAFESWSQTGPSDVRCC